jgi:hypothetical protein
MAEEEDRNEEVRGLRELWYLTPGDEEQDEDTDERGMV